MTSGDIIITDDGFSKRKYILKNVKNNNTIIMVRILSYWEYICKLLNSRNGRSEK